MRTLFDKKLLTRVAAGALLLVFFACALSSAAVTDHDCTGNHCPICLCASQREHALILVCTLLCSMSLGGIFALLSHGQRLAPAPVWSPVRLKVKLSN